jgi:hypothetical protein
VTDIPGKFKAFGWNVLEIDGHDMGAIVEAVGAAKACGSADLHRRPYRQGQGRSLYGAQQRLAQGRAEREQYRVAMEALRREEA